MSLYAKHSMNALAGDSAEDKAYIKGFNHALKLADAQIADLNNLAQELKRWLDQQEITGENIGTIRRRCFLPWDSHWNALVRDETAARERSILNPKDKAALESSKPALMQTIKTILQSNPHNEASDPRTARGNL